MYAFLPRHVIIFFSIRNCSSTKVHKHFPRRWVSDVKNETRRVKLVCARVRRNNGPPEALTQTLVLLILISGLQPHEYMVDRLVHGIRRYLRHFRVYLWKRVRANETKRIIIIVIINNSETAGGWGGVRVYLSLSVCRRTWRTAPDWIPRRTPANREHITVSKLCLHISAVVVAYRVACLYDDDQQARRHPLTGRHRERSAY